MTKWTLITGASEGLGVEFARIAAAEGRNIILAARSEDKLGALAADLRGSGIDVVVIPADLNDLDQTEALWAAAIEDREVDVLINNAGLGRHGPFASGGPDGASWHRELNSMQVNMTALTRLMKLAIPHMQANGGGRILNVASTAAFLPGPNMAVYHATKAFVLALSEAVAYELRGSGVTITAFCPGATRTRFLEDADMLGIRLHKFSAPAQADKVAQVGWRATMAGKRIAVPGFMNKISAFVPRILPRGVILGVTSILMSR